MKNKYLNLTVMSMIFFILINQTSFAQFLIEKPEIKYRLKWEDNKLLLKQYELNKKIGDYVNFPVLGKMRKRQIKFICYLSQNGDSCILNEVYSRIVLHHTVLKDQNLSAINQAKFFRDGQILDRQYGYSDIAYHFLIASDGTIIECRPLTHMGMHAGKIAETNPLLDPDYGSIGIVLVGNFDKEEPSEKQIQSLQNLLNWLKTEYHIAKQGIFYHNEIKKLVEDSNLTSLSKQKTCPGHKFPKKSWLLDQLVPDTWEALQKEIYLCK